jgi:hypothetical protein
MPSDNVIRAEAFFAHGPERPLALSWPQRPPEHVLLFCRAEGVVWWPRITESELEFLARVKQMARAIGLERVTVHRAPAGAHERR